MNFNPRSPHGERRQLLDFRDVILIISIHAPRTGSDCWEHTIHFIPRDFNPRSPHGERPRHFLSLMAGVEFQSTLPARGATPNYRHNHIDCDISIHAPRTGSDTKPSTVPRCHCRFQSTLPARGATCIRWGAPLFVAHFNPRSPHGERPIVTPAAAAQYQFQSTLPARGATLPDDGERLRHGVISIHAPRTGSDMLRFRL